MSMSHLHSHGTFVRLCIVDILHVKIGTTIHRKVTSTKMIMHMNIIVELFSQFRNSLNNA